MLKAKDRCLVWIGSSSYSLIDLSSNKAFLVVIHMTFEKTIHSRKVIFEVRIRKWSPRPTKIFLLKQNESFRIQKFSILAEEICEMAWSIFQISLDCSRILLASLLQRTIFLVFCSSKWFEGFMETSCF